MSMIARGERRNHRKVDVSVPEICLSPKKYKGEEKMQISGFSRYALLPALAMTLAACSVKLNDKVTPPDGADQRKLKVTSEKLSGTVDGKPFSFIKGLARLESNGEYSLTLVGEGVEITCGNTFPMAPHIAFVIPAQVGEYPYDGTGGGRLVNVIFPRPIVNGVGGSTNVLAVKSLIKVESIASGAIEGNLAALSSTASQHKYEFSGRFRALICTSYSMPTPPTTSTPTTPPATPEGPIAIKRAGSPAFEIAYSEAIKRNGGYEVRFTNHEPRQKCNAWEAWMMTETPIKYVAMQVPAQLGSFTIAERALEFGDQGASSGWSTKAFTGNGSVHALSQTEIALAISAKDFAGYSIEVSGLLTTTICP
jgi:hypothetical protein